MKPRSLLQRRRASFDAAAEAWADTHLTHKLSPRQRKDLAIIIAAPYAIKKTARGRSWVAVRWFANLKVDARYYLLLFLRRAPASAKDFEVEHPFLIPKRDLGGRKVIAYYDTEADRREGSFLDKYRLDVKEAA